MKVVTVNGEISPEKVGVCLPHEHLLIDVSSTLYHEPDEASKKAFVTAPIRMSNLYEVRRNPYINKNALRLLDVKLAMEEVSHFKQAGGSAVVEQTMPGHGRDPWALRAISESSGLHIVAGTGFYIEASHPESVKVMNEDQIAELTQREIESGIGGTGIRAGIIGEIGCSWAKRGSVTPAEEKVLRGVARAQTKTGAPISIHPYVVAKDAMTPLTILKEEGVDLTRVAMSHLDLLLDLDYHKTVAKTGAFVEYDCFGGEFTVEGFPAGTYVDFPKDAERIRALKKLVNDGLLEQLLISHDICLKTHLKHYGGHGYDHISRRVVPLMKTLGITQKQIDTMMIDNAAKFLAF